MDKSMANVVSHWLIVFRRVPTVDGKTPAWPWYTIVLEFLFPLHTVLRFTQVFTCPVLVWHILENSGPAGSRKDLGGVTMEISDSCMCLGRTLRVFIGGVLKLWSRLGSLL